MSVCNFGPSPDSCAKQSQDGCQDSFQDCRPIMQYQNSFVNQHVCQWLGRLADNVQTQTPRSSIGFFYAAVNALAERTHIHQVVVGNRL